MIRGGNLTQDYVEVVDMPFEGPLFTREIVEKTGVPDKIISFYMMIPIMQEEL